jgi:hypothetical protein
VVVVDLFAEERSLDHQVGGPDVRHSGDFHEQLWGVISPPTRDLLSKSIEAKVNHNHQKTDRPPCGPRTESRI